MKIFGKNLQKFARETLRKYVVGVEG
jgi:hypothetical protein